MTGFNEQFTLLLVDDNPINLMLLAKIIELDLPQVRILTATSAGEGLKLAAQESIDGAFIDVQMPKVSGLDMCRKLKADPRTASMPLVLITAHMSSPEMRAAGLDVGAYDFISQPISNIEMLARIKVMLRLCQSEKLQQQNDGQPLRQGENNSARRRWLAGLLLSGEGSQQSPDPTLIKTLAADMVDSGEIDERQLAEQLTGRFPTPWRETFQKLALLDSIPVPLARNLSDLADIEAVFAYLQRHDLVVQSAGVSNVCFKTSVAGVLRESAQRLLRREQQQEVYRLAADWYQQKDDLTSTLDYLLRAKEYPAISQLLSQTGFVLLAERYQPRTMQLLATIPEKRLAGCGWLSLFAGIGHFLNNPLEVAPWLELARTRFVTEGDRRGELLALSRQVIQYLLVDGKVEQGLQQLPRLRQLADQQFELLDPVNRLKVKFTLGLAELFFAGDLSRTEELLQQALAEAHQQDLLNELVELQLLQALLALFQGRFRVGRAALEQANLYAGRLVNQELLIDAFPVVAAALLFASGELEGFDEQHRAAERLWGRERLKNSACGPLLNFFAVLAQVARGKRGVAGEQLEVALVGGSSAFSAHLQSWLLQLRGLLNAQAGQESAALTDSTQALELRAQADGQLSWLPNLLLAGATALILQQYDRAAELLEEGSAKSQALGEDCFYGGFCAWSALLHLRRDEQEQALERLGQLFGSLRRKHLDFFFALTPELLRELLPAAMQRAEWREQLRQLAWKRLACGLDESGRLIPLANLQTLGGFQLVLGGRELNFSDVGQPSRLILALLAAAPNNALSTEVLMGTLWPDSPPNKARNSFDAALSRLRKNLENCFGKQIRQDYLVLEKGMLLLKNMLIDARQFTTAMETSRRHLQRQNLWQAELALRQAGKLWKGDFLAGYELVADLPYYREQLSQLRLEHLSVLARILQQRREIAEAIGLLQIGLQLEPTQDSLVQQLLLIYQQQGEKHAARQLLEAFRRALEAEDYDPEEITELIETLSPERLEL
ncbi:MAG: response regulator [Desulfuromonadales bacterium]|nr:response regulator [Desulfuromonadales bacterium]